MIHSHRLALIRNRLQTEHRLRVTDLAKQLDVAEETIRRDFKHLEALGELRRVHGGAVLSYSEPLPTTSSSPSTATRSKDSKMAHQVIQQIQDGMSIFLAASPSSLAVAQRLSQFKQLRVFSNALSIAQLLADDPRNSVYMIPGKVRRHDHVIVGAQSLQFVAQYHYDLAVMGTHALSLQLGVMDDDEEDAFLHQKIIQYSHRKIIMADEVAFTQPGFIQRCAFDQIDLLVTHKKPPEDFIQQLAVNHVQLLY